MCLDGDFADSVARACISRYNSLSKRGKPERGREWTKMACIVKTYEEDYIEVVCLATGTKCIGEHTRNDKGTLLNDSHAEILARRLFIKYLLKELELAIAGGESIFEKCVETNMYVLKSVFQFHLFATDTPCGDASIFPERHKLDNEIPANKRKMEQSPTDTNNKWRREQSPTHDYMERQTEPSQTKETMTCSDVNSQTEPSQTKEIVTCNDVNSQTEPSHTKETVMHDDVKWQTERSQTKDTVKRKPYCEVQRKKKDGEICFENVNLHFVQQTVIINNKIDENEHCKEQPEVTEESNNIKNNREEVEWVLDVHRTGAKCVVGGKQDLLKPGVCYHETGALRIKPGRGERTLSMSCSDKIMKWCVLGLTGGLLSNLLKSPIFLSSVVIGNSNFNRESMLRALSLRGRDAGNTTVVFNQPSILVSGMKFVDGIEFLEECESIKSSKISPSGTAILWCDECDIREVSVYGRKQGITKKNIDSPKAQTSICKKCLFEDFKTLLKATGKNESMEACLCYYDYKHACEKYRDVRSRFFNIFPEWTKKPKQLEEFT